MGRQINFYMDKETQNNFIEYCSTLGSFYAKTGNKVEQIIGTPYVIDPETPLVIDKRVKSVNGSPQKRDGYFFLYLYNEYTGGFITRKTNNNIEYIDGDKSSVVEFCATSTRITVDVDTLSKVVNKGRIYIQTGYYDESGEYIQKPEEFIKLYNKLVKWIKKNVPYKREYKMYVCDYMFALIHEGFFLL